MQCITSSCRRSSMDESPHCPWHTFDVFYSKDNGCKFPLAVDYPATLNNLVQCRKPTSSSSSRYCSIHKHMGQTETSDN